MRLLLFAGLLSMSVMAVNAQVAADEPVRPDLSGEIYVNPINKSLAPRVFMGYRYIRPHRFDSIFPNPKVVNQLWRDTKAQTEEQLLEAAETEADLNETEKPLIEQPEKIEGLYLEMPGEEIAEEQVNGLPDREELTVAFGRATPDWLRKSRDDYRFQEDFTYLMMIDHPELIQYAYRDLPVPPSLPEEDPTFLGFLKRQRIPGPVGLGTVELQGEAERINWLHTFNIALQLSQAYVSGNWYQGGNSYLAFLGNFLWDVQLNPVYHPKFIFNSTVSYKLAINSTPDDQYHKYSVSQDQFQYNLKMGYQAIHNWYYSFLTQFKTQFLNSYPANSLARTASFLSPGELNLGLGMTYTKENEKKTLKFSASISPVSYNLKICIDPNVDHSQFGIRQDRKWVNEFGSNAEVNFYAQLWGNTTYTTRLFIFTDYKVLQTDWENTLNFQFSRFFSTQIYAHLRYDTSADSSVSRKWKKLMLKEILSVGISYTFSTK